MLKFILVLCLLCAIAYAQIDGEDTQSRDDLLVAESANPQWGGGYGGYGHHGRGHGGYGGYGGGGRGYGGYGGGFGRGGYGGYGR